MASKQCPWASEALIITAICEYLDITARYRIFRYINKLCLQVVRQLSIRFPEIKKAKLVEPAGRAFSLILDVLRFGALDIGVAVSAKANSLVKSIDDMHSLRQSQELLQELQKINYSMYSHWKNDVVGNPGVFNYLLGVMDLNPGMFTYPVDWNQVYSWCERRKCENFFVLFERVDGTVLLSEDLQEVFLVQGIAQSLAEVLPNPNQIPRPYMIRSTLLPFSGYIVYDGLVTPVAHKVQHDKSLQKKIRLAYIKAFNEKKIRVIEPGGDELGPSLILAPPLMRPSERVAASSGQLAIVKRKINVQSDLTLNTLKSLPKVRTLYVLAV